jgi:PAS domain S-box-containing protein
MTPLQHPALILMAAMNHTGFMPHGYCYLWKPDLVGLHIIADGLTGLSYYSIPIALMYFLRKRDEVAFSRLILLFSAFILACGTVHFMAIWTLWFPNYWLFGILKAIVALISCYTATVLVSELPTLLSLPSLKVTNQRLEEEIVERKRLEETLINTEQLQRAILASSNYTIISTQVDGTILSFNNAAQRMLGYDEAEVIGKMTPERFHDLDEVTQAAAIESEYLGQSIAVGFETFVARARLGETQEREWTYISKNGDRTPISLAITALQDDRQILTGFLGIGRDITERKQAEESLRNLNNELEARVARRTQELSKVNQILELELEARRQAEQALREALQKLNFHVENSPLGVIEWDQDFQVSRWSSSAEKLFGWSAAEVIGKNPTEWDFVFEEDLPSVNVTIADLVQGQNRQVTLTNRNYRNDGAVICCEWYNSVLLDSNGQMESVLSLVLDVTDRYRIEQMKSEFISVVSHELRTPLTAIHGSLRMLASGLLDQQPTKQKRLIEIASDSTDRLVRLINDILDIERIESGKISLVKQQCWIPDLLTAAVDTVQSLIDQAQVTIEVQPLHQWIEVDRDRIIQTLTNLLANAIKFSQTGQQIDLIVVQEDGWAVFRVVDRGRGIPMDKIESVFERFQQVDSSDARNHEGSGLGLAICRSIIQQHFGQIWVQSQLGEGSVFSFRLPLPMEKHLEGSPLIVICENGETLGMTAHELSHSVREAHPHKNLKVLLVEDDRDLAEVLITSLGHQGISITHATTGSQAIQLTQAIIPDLIILDLILPDRDGFAVVDWLRQHQQLKEISLLIYSARDLDVLEQQELRLGQTDFITKSRVTPHEFEERVMSLLQGASLL